MTAAPRRCPVCRCVDAAPAVTPYLRCEQCHTRYVHPQPTWSERLPAYSADYRGYHRLETEPSLTVRWSMRYGLWRRLKLVEQYRAGGRLLDIGCGGGDFVARVAQERRWKAAGVERVFAMAEAARRRHRIDALTGDATATGLASARWDAITLWTVLEHTQDPTRAVRECGRLLRPGGVLIIQTISADSAAARLFGRHWLGFDAPRILTVFTPRALRFLLQANGFEVLRMGGYFHDYFPMLWSLHNVAAAHRQAGHRLAPLSAALERLAQTTLARLVTYPVMQCVTRSGKGTFLVAVARRVDE